MVCKVKSDDSGGFSVISNTIGLGSRKHVAYYGFHILVLFIISTALQINDSHVCLSLTLALQLSNEMYETIKHPYRPVLYSTKNDLICYQFTINLRSRCLCQHFHYGSLVLSCYVGMYNQTQVQTLSMAVLIPSIAAHQARLNTSLIT